MIDFKGYESGKKTSGVSGKQRLYYDRTKPFNRKVKFYTEYKPLKEIIIPRYYAVPKSEHQVIETLKRNKISMKEIRNDSVMQVEIYRIGDFKTVNTPYEGHYLHYETQTTSGFSKINFRKGDILVSTEQEGVKYLLETLEPEAKDSFFNWNFFDAVLGQKEYFSDYVFEDTAEELLKNDKALRETFKLKKEGDPDFAKDGDAQLDWIYKNSPYYEGTVNRYPIFRIP
jgi:hypothetical protein